MNEKIWRRLDARGREITRLIAQAKSQEDIDALLSLKQLIIDQKARYAIIYCSDSRKPAAA